MFADIDDVGILLDDVGNGDCGSYQIILDSQFIESLENAEIEMNVLFNGAFAYALSRFIGSENILFNTVLNESNSALLVNCKNQDASSFMNYVADLIENISKYDCPFEEIESEYDAKSNIMFQYSADNDAVTDSSFDFNVNISLKEYGFDLVKKGNKNQNMFLLPPVGGLSFVFFDLVNNIDFDGNIYLIDDFKYDLSLDELKTIRSNDITFNHYYDAIKDIFQSGDIIVGFSLGCIYASLLCEKLEQNKQVAKCILIDGTMNFVDDEEISTDDLIKEYCEVEYNEIINNRSGEFKDKFIEILRINSNWNFHTPKIESPVKYLATSDLFKEDLDKISDNPEFVLIDSNHNDIIHKDIDKIINYLK